MAPDVVVWGFCCGKVFVYEKVTDQHVKCRSVGLSAVEALEDGNQILSRFPFLSTLPLEQTRNDPARLDTAGGLCDLDRRGDAS